MNTVNKIYENEITLYLKEIKKLSTQLTEAQDRNNAFQFVLDAYKLVDVKNKEKIQTLQERVNVLEDITKSDRRGKEDRRAVDRRGSAADRKT